MTRRSLFKTLLGCVAAPFVPSAVARHPLIFHRERGQGVKITVNVCGWEDPRETGRAVVRQIKKHFDHDLGPLIA